jgi:hypothetical protein
MLNEIPYKPKKFYDNMNNVDFNNFFGFCLAKIETPTNLIKPLLPYRMENGQIKYPLGS